MIRILKSTTQTSIIMIDAALKFINNIPRRVVHSVQDQGDKATMFKWPILLFSLIFLLQSCIDEASMRAGQAAVKQFSQTKTDQTEDSEQEEPEEELPKRPEGQVYVQRDVCACENGKPVIDGNCLSFCASKNDKQATLYGEVKLGPEVDLMFGSLLSWCKASLGEHDVGANCFLRIRSENDMRDLPITLLGLKNHFAVNIYTAYKDQPYIAKLVVINEAGLQAESDSFQFIKKDPVDPTTGPLGVLKVVPISRYNCLFRAIRLVANGDEEAAHVGRINFFFPANEEPPIIPYSSAGERYYYCHDVQAHGVRDSSEYQRLGLEPHYLTLWDKSDLRFYETMKQGKLDINTLIEKKLKDEYNIDADINLFAPFSWPNYPLDGATIVQGFYMVPWSDPVTGKTFCPTEKDYNSDRPEFRVLKEFIGQDTEGLYFAKKDPETVEDEDHQQIPVPDDYLLIRESLLKKIWFYYESTGPSTRKVVPADADTANRKTIHFYWPVIYDENGEPESPFQYKSTQRIYTVVRDTASLQSNGATQDGNRTVIPTSDKRFGCIPITRK